MNDSTQLALTLHKQFRGKISISLRDNPDSREKLSAYYSPGVAAISSLIAEQPEQLRNYTWTNNLVAVVSNGSAVLGLGDIGPKAAMPVMEGKALLFKKFANIDSVPIVLNATTADEIVAVVTAIAPSFGAINLEDIAAPICFEVEERLKAALDIPVFHDDQHGTAIVTLAGIINALKLKKTLKIEDARICIVGAGAAGTAIALLLHKYGAKDIAVVDSRGILSTDRTDLNHEKRRLLALNQLGRHGDLTAAITNADIFIGVSKAGLLTPELVAMMQSDPIIFALANPNPEIMPDIAKQAGAFIIATGRSDFPNQVNNAVAFPGIFRGALDNNITKITDDHKIAAAEAIASLVEHPSVDRIIPSVFNEKLVSTVANVIR